VIDTDLILLDFNTKSLRDSITDRNASYSPDNNNKNNDNDDNDNIEVDEDNMDFLIPIIFNPPPHLCYNFPETTIQRRNSSTSYDTNFTIQTSSESLLNIYPSSNLNHNGLNITNLASNNGSNTSFISFNESIPDPYFHYDSSNSTSNLEVNYI